MTREELIQIIYNDSTGKSCPDYNCIIEPNHSNCIACAERQLKEYESKIREKAIDELTEFLLMGVDKGKRIMNAKIKDPVERFKINALYSDYVNTITQSAELLKQMNYFQNGTS